MEVVKIIMSAMDNDNGQPLFQIMTPELNEDQKEMMNGSTMIYRGTKDLVNAFYGDWVIGNLKEVGRSGTKRRIKETWWKP